MLFTPLLASTSVGTLEFRSIAEPLKYAHPDVEYHKARVTAIDPRRKLVTLETDPDTLTPKGGDPVVKTMTMPYDLLLIGVGARVNTFNIPNVEKHAFFLKELSDARAIRSKIIRTVEASTLPDVTPWERRRLLTFLIVGGGPTGIEFAAELHDFVVEDLLRMYPHAAADVTITVIEGKQILGGFDASLREYTERKFRRDKIRLRTGANVTHLGPTTAQLSDGDKLDFGVCIWNTGIAPNVRWDGGMFRTDKWGHIVVNEYMKALKPADTSQQAGAVQHAKSPASENTPPTAATDDVFTSDQPGTQVPCIWAVGDAAAVGTTAYAATAQVAEQQGTWLAHALNEAARVAPAGTRAAAGASAGGAAPPPPPRTPSGAALSIEDRVAAIAAYTPREPFRYQHRGSLAFIGTFAAVSDFTKAALPIHGARVKGIAAWLVWRSAYLTKLGSWRNRVQVPLDWTRTLLFGRDTTQF